MQSGDAVGNFDTLPICEHFEQQPIDTEDGDLYVSFWNSGDNYSIMTHDELDAYIDNQGMTMGGM